MKYIQKNSEPTALLNYKKNSDATYLKMKNTDRKVYKEVKESLLDEQGYICCYCCRQIQYASSQIEHIYPKSDYKEIDLDYDNLLTCCDGGKKDRNERKIASSEVCCEARKLSEILPVNPLMTECESKFLFSRDGDIIGIGAEAEKTIRILNLTSPYIANLRKGAFNNYKLNPPADWNVELQKLNNKKPSGEYIEFCFVLKNYIKNFILNKK